VTHEYETAVISDLDVRAATRISDVRRILQKIGFSKREAERLASVAWDILQNLQGGPGVVEEQPKHADFADALRRLTAQIKDCSHV